jgi:hypothetical protein
MAPNPRTKKPAASLAAHATLGTAGNDRWQRQADAAAWSAISGMAPSLYLGAIEPIAIPPDLRDQLRAAGQQLAAEPSDQRAATLLRLAHEAVYGAPPPESLFPAAPAAAGGVSDGDWWDSAETTEKPLAAFLLQASADAFTALQAAEPDPEGAGEQEEDWWV